MPPTPTRLFALALPPAPPLLPAVPPTAWPLLPPSTPPCPPPTLPLPLLSLLLPPLPLLPEPVLVPLPTSALKAASIACICSSTIMIRLVNPLVKHEA